MSGPRGVPMLLLWVSACLWLSWQAQGALIISGIPKSLVNNNFCADFKNLHSLKFNIYNIIITIRYFILPPPVFQSQETNGAARLLQVFKLSDNSFYYILTKQQYVNDFNYISFFALPPQALTTIILKSFQS